MKLTVLGCSGSMPGPDSPASGYLIEADGYKLVLDLGHGAFGALQRYVDPVDVDAIVVSHLHADHCIDLTAYIVALRYGAARYRVPRPRDASRSSARREPATGSRRPMTPTPASSACTSCSASRRRPAVSSARSRCRSRR